MNNNLKLALLTSRNIPEIAKLGKQLNPKLAIKQIESYLTEMFSFDNYNCFGFYQNDQLIGVSSGWITVRLYCGKQLELDNVIIDHNLQSKGLGSLFFELIENWAKQHGFDTIELNTYVQNSKSHKFYFNKGFEIIGYHFQKKI